MIACKNLDCPCNNYEMSRCDASDIEISARGCNVYEQFKIERQAEVEKITLKPCPFCRGKAELVLGFIGGAAVGCTKCRVMVDGDNRDIKSAAEKWNKRRIDDE